MQVTVLLQSNISSFQIEKVKYTPQVGLIMYAIVETRVDIAFAISMASKFAKKSLARNISMPLIKFYNISLEPQTRALRMEEMRSSNRFDI